ncbi:PDDEXK nuclease domain-containing protein [Blautia obeum]|uniref:PDDEXK nuclease domain-containing protein n=1 Tax=Blautia obeum TaxID=40520 RepID=UPI00156DEA09|nr:PDDEXK nuclease domain-containing protein [Blautia obeum]
MKNNEIGEAIQNDFLKNVSDVLRQAKKNAKTAVNLSMVYAYYEIGRMIVEEEQHGTNRAAYGKQLLKELSAYLTDIFGKGFSTTNLKQMRQFYIAYANDQISQTLSDQFETLPTVSTGRKFFLSWSHYLKLMRIDNIDERHFYEIESVKNDWSLSELKRQYNSALYERLALSTDKDKVYQLALEGQKVETPKDAVKDPYVLEFLGLKELPEYSESELESRIIDHLQQFLLELGTGFAFIGRQVRFTFDEEHFMVDLVFYNRLLRCFVLFDLKIGELKHQDIGQMQMYVNYYDRKVKLEDENKTIGIVLCRDKNNAVVEMTLPEDNSQIFASKYETVLPKKEDLKKLLEERIVAEDGGEDD